MSIATRLYYGLGYLIPLAGGDVEYGSASPASWFPGQCGYMIDKYGERYMQLVQNRSTATIVQGALVSSIGDNTGLTGYTATSGTTLTVVGGATLVANKHVGAIIIVKDDAGAAGAAPEGEDSIIVENSTTTIKIHKDLPFSAAVAASDTVEILNTWGVELSAAGDYAHVVRGVVIPESGLLDTYYGFAQYFGHCRRVNCTASVVLAPGSMLIAGTGTVNVTGAASGHRLHVGTSRGTLSTDAVLAKCVALLSCGAHSKSYSDTDALA